MNREEAAQLLEHELANLRGESYADLVRRIPERLLAFERSAVGGTTSQAEIQFLWDDRPGVGPATPCSEAINV
jgi:hypothetical protein